jgi:nicotinate-nucleotide pyrophosphorylase (carboxylating)
MSNSPESLSSPYELLYEPIVVNALVEDLGRAGDLTTDAIVSAETQAAAQLVTRAAGRLAGMDVALCAFRCLDPRIEVEIHSRDGAAVEAGDLLAILRGAARPLLSAERTALNLLGRLSGIATQTSRIVSAIAPWPARVVCTRKTTPGLRALEKYAVRAGGGSNHRFGLDDAVLIKDNHRVIAGGVSEAIRRVRLHVGHMVKIEVEVDTLAELEEALALKVDAILLDNMPVETLKRGVGMARGKAITEASGNVTPESAPAIAATGVDLISIGWITHSAPSLDVALDFAHSL